MVQENIYSHPSSMVYSARMQVVIFCGGQGTRMREETETRPKPMVSVGGRPILWHIMKIFAHYGHTDFVLPLGYKGEQIKEYFLNYHSMNGDVTVGLGEESHIQHHDVVDEHNFRVTLSDTGLDSMTGCRLARVKRHVKNNTFLCTYGDGLSDIDIDKLVAFHRAHGKIATVTSVPTISRFGVIETADDGTVLSFAEKPDTSSWINAGFFVFEPQIFDYAHDDPTLVLEKKVMEKLTADRQLMAYKHDGFFYAMDTYREYLHLNHLWDTGKAPWAHWRKISAEENAKKHLPSSH